MEGKKLCLITEEIRSVGTNGNLIFPPFPSRSIFKVRNLLMEASLSLRVKPITEVFSSPGKLTGNHKSSSPFVIIVETDVHLLSVQFGAIQMRCHNGGYIESSELLAIEHRQCLVLCQ